MAMQPFGLDIGATTMKAVWLQPKKEGFLLKSASIVPTPSKGILSESPLDQEEMAQALRALITEAKIGTRTVNIALPENQVYTRVLDMPILSEKELASAIYWEAEQYIPVPLETMTLDWRILKQPEAKDTALKMQVLLVGASSALISKYDRIMQLANINIVAVETEIISCIRALITGDNFPNSIVVSIGAVSTSLAIVKQGIITFTYTISTGGAAINRAIAADFGFTESQAEEYKKVYGVSEKNLGGKIGQATTPILTTITNEVKKAIALYTERHKSEDPLRQIILSGGTAKLPGIDLFFAQNCGMETVLANPWKVLVSQEVPKAILDEAAGYTIAVGLAMRNDD